MAKKKKFVSNPTHREIPIDNKRPVKEILEELFARGQVERIKFNEEDKVRYEELLKKIRGEE